MKILTLTFTIRGTGSTRELAEDKFDEQLALYLLLTQGFLYWRVRPYITTENDFDSNINAWAKMGRLIVSASRLPNYEEVFRVRLSKSQGINPHQSGMAPKGLVLGREGISKLA